MPTKIEWVVNPDGSRGETINPLGWGCLRRCKYCYAAVLAKRNLRGCPDCNAFIPHWHQEQVDKVIKWRKPRTIFVQSMGDLFGLWVEEWKIETVLKLAQSEIHHLFLLLTKYPERYKDFNPWPSNCWLGATATNGTTWWAGQHHLSKAEWIDGKRRSYISLEPLLGPVGIMEQCPAPPVQWLIVGGQTGPGAKSTNSLWTLQAFAYAQKHGIPAFGKDNLRVDSRPRDLPYMETPNGFR